MNDPRKKSSIPTQDLPARAQLSLGQPRPTLNAFTEHRDPSPPCCSQTGHLYKVSEESEGASDKLLPVTFSRASEPPSMPTLPEEEQDSPKEPSRWSSPSMSSQLESRGTDMTLCPTAPGPPRQALAGDQVNPTAREQHRLRRARAWLARNLTPSSGSAITSVDSTGNVIDLLRDRLPELQLSDAERQQNQQLLLEARRVSERFRTRRGRRFTSSPSRTHTAAGKAEQNHISPRDSQSCRTLDWKPNEKCKGSSGQLCPRYPILPRSMSDPQLGGGRGRNVRGKETGLGRGGPRKGADMEAIPARGVAKPVPHPSAQQEVRAPGGPSPMMQAVTWDAIGSLLRDGSNLKLSKPPLKSPRHQNPPTPKQQGRWQKLAKMREEHQLLRHHAVRRGSRLPDLSETAEQDRGTPPEAEGNRDQLDVLPHISDITLRKLKLHRAACGAPPLTEKEVENAFVQLSLAFRNDSYTLETRQHLAERERSLTEENTERELNVFKGFLKGSIALWQGPGQEESHRHLLQTAAVLHLLAVQLSSRAEMVGAMRQEKRMNKASQVMMQYVENLKRTYEKDHAELMEFRKLANLNSSRYAGSNNAADDGIPRSTRSASLTLGKPLPRRRVSVAVVPKFNLLNVPGSTPATPTLPSPQHFALGEAHSVKSSPLTDPRQSAVMDGKMWASLQGQTAAPAKSLCKPEDMVAQIKARIEEDAYNKGFLEGLRRSKMLQEQNEKEKEEERTEEEETMQKKHNRTYGQGLDSLSTLSPKFFRWSWKFKAMVLLVVTFCIVSFFIYYSAPYGEAGGVSTGQSVCPGKKKLFSWNMQYQPTNPRPQ
ncbi:hypothetical protein AGOR_G00000060 [Albula goreensis]|uniref:Protein MRVI1 n=1 Tax=Albula goreensis TaxID=1534307 RepID=A0A8T3E324_9TELE|nr:hypothetical protein AGOR_G00000060 [Albula goreensis]